MDFVELRTRLGRFVNRLWDWWLGPDDEEDDFSFYEPDVKVPYSAPPPLPMTKSVVAVSDPSPIHDMIVLLKACRQDLDDSLDQPIRVDSLPMDEIRRLIVDACPHQISARFTFLARWDEIDDPVENWVSLNQIATMLMTIEVYFWPENPRVRILRQACEARARIAEQLLDMKVAA